MEIYTSGGDGGLRQGRWNDISCSRSRKVVCQRGAVLPTYNTTWISSADVDNDAEYAMLFSATSWSDADAECRALDASSRLASIASAEENAFVEQFVRERAGAATAWIGLQSTDDANVYAWSDGSVAGEPLQGCSRECVAWLTRVLVPQRIATTMAYLRRTHTMCVRACGSP